MQEFCAGGASAGRVDERVSGHVAPQILGLLLKILRFIERRASTNFAGPAAPATNEVPPENINRQIVDRKLEDGGAVTAVGRGGRHGVLNGRTHQ
jgi:hypothetical protein